MQHQHNTNTASTQHQHNTNTVPTHFINYATKKDQNKKK